MNEIHTKHWTDIFTALCVVTTNYLSLCFVLFRFVLFLYKWLCFSFGSHSRSPSKMALVYIFKTEQQIASFWGYFVEKATALNGGVQCTDCGNQCQRCILHRIKSNVFIYLPQWKKRSYLHKHAEHSKLWNFICTSSCTQQKLLFSLSSQGWMLFCLCELNDSDGVSGNLYCFPHSLTGHSSPRGKKMKFQFSTTMIHSTFKPSILVCI